MSPRTVVDKPTRRSYTAFILLLLSQALCAQSPPSIVGTWRVVAFETHNADGTVNAVPILDRYGIPATFFLIANQEPTLEPWLGHKEDWWKIDWRGDDIETLKRLINDGHEIGSHSVTHDLQKMQANPLSAARDSKQRIEEWLETEVTSFCYPYYRSHAYLEDSGEAEH
jgi:peptidoglycan/xylan/chitin deacetylase (PgdA/CDA1 family)